MKAKWVYYDCLKTGRSSLTWWYMFAIPHWRGYDRMTLSSRHKIGGRWIKSKKKKEEKRGERRKRIFKTTFTLFWPNKIKFLHLNHVKLFRTYLNTDNGNSKVCFNCFLDIFNHNSYLINGISKWSKCWILIIKRPSVSLYQKTDDLALLVIFHIIFYYLSP